MRKQGEIPWLGRSRKAGILLYCLLCGKTKRTKENKIIPCCGLKTSQGFFMPSSISGLNQQIKPGTCPHGLPVGACPICSGKMSGGGTSKTSNTRKPGEMTWSQCFQAGVMMRAQSQRAETMKNLPLYNFDVAKALGEKISNFTNNVAKLITVLQNSLPPGPAKFIATLNKTLITPLLNVLNQIPKVLEAIQTGITNIRNFVSQVAEKLASLVGEFKNFVAKKLSDFAKVVKKKFLKLFSIFGIENEDDEENKEFFELFTSKKN